jgi:hypothetical protein
MRRTRRQPSPARRRTPLGQCDSEGSLVMTEVDVEGDGIIDERTRYDYSCHP